jgi:hypothetical protein
MIRGFSCSGAGWYSPCRDVLHWSPGVPLRIVTVSRQSSVAHVDAKVHDCGGMARVLQNIQ